MWASLRTDSRNFSSDKFQNIVGWSSASPVERWGFISNCVLQNTSLDPSLKIFRTLQSSSETNTSRVECTSCTRQFIPNNITHCFQSFALEDFTSYQIIHLLQRKFTFANNISSCLFSKSLRLSKNAQPVASILHLSGCPAFFSLQIHAYFYLFFKMQDKP